MGLTRRLASGVAALLVQAIQPVPLGAAMTGLVNTAIQKPAAAQSAEDVAKIAQAIAVRIEGATQGSGVLMKRDGNYYTVLTAWHVVSWQRPREELDIYTPDGQKHPVEHGSIKRLRDVDMAVLSFSSSNAYGVARVGDVKSVSMGSPVYVAGFPLSTLAVDQRILRFLDGKIIANASVYIANGYQLLYSNLTLPGMSGGPVLNVQGELVGIHGQGETDIKLSEQADVAVKTGTNQGVPVVYYIENSFINLTASELPVRSGQPRGIQESRTDVGIVRFGDTLLKLSERYRITLQELLRLNPGLETARLVVGAQITVPRTKIKPSSSLLAW